jgi:hypothetical protein
VQPGNWQNRLSEPVVPLSKIQIDVLQLLAAHRDPENYGREPAEVSVGTGHAAAQIGQASGLQTLAPGACHLEHA